MLIIRFIDFLIGVIRKILFLATKARVRLFNTYHASKSDRWDQALYAYYERLKSVALKLNQGPVISIILPVFKVKTKYLQECLASIGAQIYDRWEVCIVDDGSCDPEIERILKLFQQKHEGKVKLRLQKENQGISAASQVALNFASGQYVALLDHDDRLTPNALLEMVRAIHNHDHPDILYSDECRISEEGVVESTFFKPDWSPLFGLACHYSTHLSLFKTELLKLIGGFRSGFDGSQDHDLMLRACEKTQKSVIHVPLVLYQWRAHAQSTARSVAAKPYAAIAGEKAVREACLRRGWPASVTYDRLTERYRVKFDLRDTDVLVSIIILSRDSFQNIYACLKSIFAKTTYENFQIILVDHQTVDKNCLELFARLEIEYPQKFEKIQYRGEFNFAAMNNEAAKIAEGRYLLFLNNDTEAVEGNWLDELLSVAQLPSSGAVGAKLIFQDRSLQHAGIVGLGQGIAGNAGLNFRSDSLHYYSYLQVTHEVLAVTGACLLVAREKFQTIGGFNETDVPNGFGDVDLCLRLSEKGYSNVYVPHAVLYHKELTTRKASFEIYEKSYMLARWGKELTQDPYLNPNLQKSIHYQINFDSLYQVPMEPLFQTILKPFMV